MLSPDVLLLLCFAASWLQAVAQGSASTAAMPTATIANGTVVGTTTSISAATATVNKFLGIPFAQSPPQRFTPPRARGAFNSTLMAQQYPPACIQQFNYPEAVRNFTQAVFNFPPPSSESEDCLYLNVFAPSTPAPAGGRAVMFWIYGGGFQFGTGNLVEYDASSFAAYQDVVVVTHNYRTNVFGFLASSSIPTTQRNLGLLDQRMAMQWVQDNIRSFGGDPSKVTIFGESAGGFSVDAHLTSYTTNTAPFRAAIMESGQVSYIAANSTRTNNDASVQQLAQKLNCTGDVLTCLRAAPASTLKNTIELNALSFPPVIDNYTYVANRAARRAAGQFAEVPTLIGTNANEGRIFELGMMNLTDYVQTVIGALDPDVVAPVLQAFPTNSTVSGYDQISQIFTLLQFQCGSSYLATQNSRLNISTWRYYFNAYFPNSSPLDGLLRAYHGSEIPLVFNTYPGGPVIPVPPVNGTVLPVALPATPQQYALGQYMNSAWATFAKNPQLGPGWGKVQPQGGLYLGVLGGLGGTTAGVEIANSSVIDANCLILRPIFEKFSGVSLSSFNT